MRFTTTTPLQALGMLNGEFAQRHARGFARRLASEAGTTRERIALGLRLALGREGSAEEVRGLTLLAEELEAGGEVDRMEALTDVCLVILNLNEFLYLD